MPLGGLTAQQERLRILPLTAEFERTEVLIPEALRRFRFGFSPQLELVEVRRADLSLADSVEQVVAERRRQIGPPNLRHHPPKVRRANSSLRCFCSAAFVDRASRSTRSRKRFFS